MRILVKDGVRYFPHKYKNEDELESFVKEHIRYIFDSNCFFFDKTKIESRAGIRTIPDGFVIARDKWYIIEVELSGHPLHDHIVSQISKFNSAIGNAAARHRLTSVFYDEIKRNTDMQRIVASMGISVDTYKHLTDVVIHSTPQIVIIIDSKTPKLEEACKSLRSPPKIIEFKTYCCEKVEVEVPIHSFDVVKDKSVAAKRKTPPFVGKLISQESEDAKTHRPRSEGLAQILDVARLYYQGKPLTEAFKLVAKQRNVTPNTVRERCTRSIGMRKHEFENRLKNRQSFIAFLLKRFPQDEDTIRQL